MGIVHPMDPVIGTCNIPWRKSPTGFVQVTSQVSSTPSFTWGLQLTKPGETAIGNPATVSLFYAYLMVSGSSNVRILYPLSLYGPHKEDYPYIFHGSFSTYNYVGSSTKVQLKHGDILDLKFMIDGARGTDFTTIECKVP